MPITSLIAGVNSYEIEWRKKFEGQSLQFKRVICENKTCFILTL